MKSFEDYKDGEWVFYKNNYNDRDYQFQAYKSQYTHNAFRLKNHNGEVIADISEITPMLVKLEDSIINSDGLPGMSFKEFQQRIDSDADSSGIYQVQD